jgi:hypothetical protein
MSRHRHLIKCAVGGLLMAAWATTLGGLAAAGADTVDGCHGLSPASAQECTADQLRRALDWQR